MAFTLDQNLKEYATPLQWERLQALETHGSERAAAQALGIHRRNFANIKAAVLKKAAMHGYAPDFDMIYPAPFGMKSAGTSTLYDMQTGDPKLQWVKTKPDQEAQDQAFREAVEAMASDIPRVARIKGPRTASEMLMACYPVGDHHLGMLSWDEEAGENYDLTIGEELLMKATDHLLEATPQCEQALIAFLGDFMHYDSFEAVTPTARNQLDADSRFPKMVRAAIRSMRYLIEAAAARHKQVHVIVEIGNHDLSSSIFLMECLANLYADNPRITVDTSPSHFHYFHFGNCLIGTHHGHGPKMDRLPMIMATDQPALWGQTEHRMWWTGHLHHTLQKDQDGVTTEQFNVLAPGDAYHANKGYRSQRGMKAIMLHRDHGEVGRYIVNPDMLKD